MPGDRRPSEGSAARGGLAGLAIAAFGVACCGVLPLLVAALGGLALGALLGIAGGVIGLAALAALLGARLRQQRSCMTDIGAAHDAALAGLVGR